MAYILILSYYHPTGAANAGCHFAGHRIFATIWSCTYYMLVCERSPSCLFSSRRSTHQSCIVGRCHLPLAPLESSRWRKTAEGLRLFRRKTKCSGPQRRCLWDLMSSRSNLREEFMLLLVNIRISPVPNADLARRCAARCVVL